MNNGKRFDSHEEELVAEWCEELFDYKFINKYELHPKPFNLSNTVYGTRVTYRKTKEDLITDIEYLHSHHYTADIKIKWNKDAYGIFCVKVDDKKYSTNDYLICDNNLISYIEVKPIFDQNNMTMMFSINKKWVYKEYGHYVNTVIPSVFNKPRTNLFQKTFVPQYLYHTLVYKKRIETKKGVKNVGDSKLKFVPTFLEEYIDKKQTIKNRL